jgi:hypothetical protein
MLKEGVSIVYRLYEQNLKSMTYTYLGEISLATIIKHSLIKKSSKFESGYYFWKEKAEPFLV